MNGVPVAPAALSEPERRALFERLMLPQREALRRLAYRISGERDCAEDLVQEALLRAYARLETFRPPDGRDGQKSPHDAARAWLFAILRNQFFNDLRRRRRDALAVPFEEDGLSAGERFGTGGGDPAARLLTRAAYGAALEAVHDLPDFWRLPLLMVDCEGRSYGETARALGIPINTVRTRLHRARKGLRRHLSEWQDG